jgi:hypothetical protein
MEIAAPIIDEGFYSAYCEESLRVLGSIMHLANSRRFSWELLGMGPLVMHEHSV